MSFFTRFRSLFNRSTAIIPNADAVELAAVVLAAVLDAARVNGTGKDKFNFAMRALAPMVKEVGALVAQIAIEAAVKSLRSRAL